MNESVLSLKETLVICCLQVTDGDQNYPCTLVSQKGNISTLSTLM